VIRGMFQVDTSSLVAYRSSSVVYRGELTSLLYAPERSQADPLRGPRRGALDRSCCSASIFTSSESACRLAEPRIVPGQSGRGRKCSFSRASARQTICERKGAISGVPEGSGSLRSRAA